MPLRTKESSDSVRRSRSPAHAALSPLAHARVGARRARSRHGRRPGRSRRRARRAARRCPRLRGPDGAACASPWSASTGRAPARSGSGRRRSPARFGPWRPAQPEAEDQPDAGSDEGDAQAGWRARQPLVDGVGALHPVPRRGRGDPPAHVLRRQPGDRRRPGAGRDDTAGHVGDGTRSRPGAAADHHPAQPPGTPTRRSSAALRRSPARLRFSVGAPHRRLEQLLGGGIGGDRARDPALPRPRERLGRHRLQLPRRQVRPGVRGTRRRDHAERRSAPTPAASTPAASASRSSATTTRPRSPRPRARPSRTCSPGGSTSGTSIRARRSTRVSAGSSRWPAGANVRLRAVSRATATRARRAAPATRIYGQARVDRPERHADRACPSSTTPRPRAASAASSASPGGSRLRAPWLVEVKDAAGNVVAQGSGTGRAIDWTWDASAVPIAYYTYTISAGPDVRPSTLPGPGPAAAGAHRVLGLAAGADAERRLERRSGVRALRAHAESDAWPCACSTPPTSGVVRTLLAERRAGCGRPNDGLGREERLAARSSRTAATGSRSPPRTASSRSRARRTLVVDTTLGGFSASPSLVSLNGDGRAEPLQIGYALTRQAAVKVQIRRGAKTMRTIFSGSQPAGAYTVDWNGLGKSGKRLADGELTAVAVATTSLGARALSRPFTLDTHAPAIRVHHADPAQRCRAAPVQPERGGAGAHLVGPQPVERRRLRRPGGAGRRAGLRAEGTGVRLPHRRGGRRAEPLVTDPALLKDLSALDCSAFPGELDLEPSAPVDPDGGPRLAVHEHAPPAEEVPRGEPVVEGVEAFGEPAAVGLLQPGEEVGEDRCPLAAGTVGRKQRAGREPRVRGELLARLVDVQADAEDDRRRRRPPRGLPPPWRRRPGRRWAT